MRSPATPRRPAAPLVVTAIVAIGAAVACGDGASPGPGGAPSTVAAASRAIEPVTAEPQRPGDPAAGYQALVNRDYIGCGIPASLYRRFARMLGGERLPDRDGASAALPYYLTASRSEGGVDVVTTNCLGCHASHLFGELVIGLGESRLDFSTSALLPLQVADRMVSDPAERRAWEALRRRLVALAPHIQTETAGSNPADAIAAVLFAHRDPETLAWSDRPLIEIAPRAALPVDVPPWWHMRKKHAMFYTAAGRGDHARIMMTASTLCTDSVERAREIDAYFPDIRAFISSLEPPRYPFEIDRRLAEEGARVFARTCGRCHGSYGPDGRYPNRVVPVQEIGTDPALADGSGQFSAPFVDWFNRSFYGEIARLEPQAGYIAPPLDGVWATAPYFHNGSVPTVAAVLESSARPRRWRRPSLRVEDYDQAALGWRYEVPADREAVGPQVYDTARRGHAATGHRYGDALSPGARRAVIEYLKTL